MHFGFFNLSLLFGIFILQILPRYHLASIGGTAHKYCSDLIDITLSTYLTCPLLHFGIRFAIPFYLVPNCSFFDGESFDLVQLIDHIKRSILVLSLQ